MPSYAITGVSRGLGWELMKQLSSDPSNTVIGIVRNKPPTDKRVAEELSGRSNITILNADLSKRDTLKKAAAEAEAILGGGLDYLFASAAYITDFDAFDGLGTLAEKPEQLSDEFHQLMDTNVLAYIHLYSAFLPLILKGKAKKVVAITSGLGDIDWTNEYELEAQSLYAISKAALNMMTAKFNAQYKKYGVLFLSVCPGLVEVGHFQEPTEEQKAKWVALMAKFSKYAPNFKGPDTPEQAVKAVLSVVANSSLEQGDGGAFLSKYKNKQWL
ncbi:hypothetical protein DL766_004970 [Monosporascus sp. MC13-8B]|uniref:NAD(P)-binding protein n=1 Tax=Monosporascus cannonballus TaxID=155416 RepID=A0ABY0H640_9PEZI|nr:hypothetical protein DL762_006095 [Monosporascus cannonballus]RYO87995.1 hypothetical protein DL763_006147 [Monosporascus cannonballus]RYP30236.1 hypothetical protein DL766_004970 [Monosporascus sp. MC13-8B]